MFKQPTKEVSEANAKEMVTVVGHLVQVEGNFISQGDIIIDGEVMGSIKTERNLQVGQSAKVTASIQAANALIGGEVKGNLKIKEHLELSNTARVNGDIRTKTLTVSPGAIFNGKCSMGNLANEKEEVLDTVKTQPVIEKQNGKA